SIPPHFFHNRPRTPSRLPSPPSRPSRHGSHCIDAKTSTHVELGTLASNQSGPHDAPSATRGHHDERRLPRAHRPAPTKDTRSPPRHLLADGGVRSRRLVRPTRRRHR